MTKLEYRAIIAFLILALVVTVTFLLVTLSDLKDIRGSLSACRAFFRF